LSYQAPPTTTNLPDPKDMQGWTKIRTLFAHRWPEWNPSDQEHRDFRRILKNMNYSDLDEAMLQVKVNYSSKIPQLKWIVTAYHRLRDERQKGQRSQSAQREDEALAAELRQVESERQECMSRLQNLPPNRLQEAIRLAREQNGRFLTGEIPTEVLQMSWLHRYAVLFALDQVAMYDTPSPLTDEST